jgi:AsmA family protein
MTKWKRRTLIWLGAIFGILAVAAGVFIWTFNWNDLKQYVSAGIAKATGRKLTIDGDVKVDLGWISRVRASQIRFENASWSQHPQMAEIGSLDLQVDLWQLFKWRLVFPTVSVSQVKVFLEKNAQGTANWDFGGLVPATVPENRTQVPVIEKLIVKDGTLVFTNQETRAQLELNLTQAEAGGFWEQPVMLKAQGYYQKQPMTLSLDGGSYQNLSNAKETYPLQINLSAGKTTAKINGNLTEPLAMKGEDVTLDIQGDDMANLFPLIRLVFPSTPPYRLKGHLNHVGNVWSFSNFSGRVGGSDLSGEIRVDTGPKRHVMKADLVSNTLDFKDLAGFIGGKPGEKKTETAEEQPKPATPAAESDRIFPDQHYSLERLRAMDADIRLRAKRILAPNLPIDNLDGKLTLNDGVLRFAPATFGVANGRVEIYGIFDGSKEVPKVNIDLRARELDLKRFFGQSSFAQKTLGPIGGRILLSGSGNSFRELMSTASGNSFVVMSGGQISEMLVELAGLDVADVLGLVVTGDKSIPIRCGLLDISGRDGQMDIQTLVFDTSNTVISGEGKIDLRDEKLNVVLMPVPKDFSFLSLRSYLRVTGRIKNMSVFPDPLKTGTESLFAKILNVLVMLVMSPLQPRDLGLGRDVNCDELLARVREKDSQGVVPKEFHESGGAKRAAVNQPQKQG